MQQDKTKFTGKNKTLKKNAMKTRTSFPRIDYAYLRAYLSFISIISMKLVICTADGLSLGRT